MQLADVPVLSCHHHECALPDSLAGDVLQRGWGSLGHRVTWLCASRWRSYLWPALAGVALRQRNDEFLYAGDQASCLMRCIAPLDRRMVASPARLIDEFRRCRRWQPMRNHLSVFCLAGPLSRFASGVTACRSKASSGQEVRTPTAQPSMCLKRLYRFGCAASSVLRSSSTGTWSMRIVALASRSIPLENRLRTSLK